jgi:PTS system fructose-specific IIC component
LLDLFDKAEQERFGEQSFTEEKLGAAGYRVLAVTACPTGIAHTYMAAENLQKAGKKLGISIKVETNGSDGVKNELTAKEIAECDGIVIVADKNVEMDRFDGKPVIITRVADGIHKPEELIKDVTEGKAPIFHGSGEGSSKSAVSGQGVGSTVYKHLMNGVSHMLPFVVGGGILIALAFLLDDYSIDPSNFGTNTPVAAFFKGVGGVAFNFMLPILAGFIAMSIADRPGLIVGFVGGALAASGDSFSSLDFYLNVTNDGDGSHVGIEDAEPVVEFSVYPNPATDRLAISGVNGLNEVSVIDVTGRTVMTLGATNSIDVSGLAAGVYVVRIATEQGIGMQKFVKE